MPGFSTSIFASSPEAKRALSRDARPDPASARKHPQPRPPSAPPRPQALHPASTGQLALPALRVRSPSPPAPTVASVLPPLPRQQPPTRCANLPALSIMSMSMSLALMRATSRAARLGPTAAPRCLVRSTVCIASSAAASAAPAPAVAKRPFSVTRAARSEEETFEEFTARYEKEFEKVNDVFELQVSAPPPRSLRSAGAELCAQRLRAAPAPAAPPSRRPRLVLTAVQRNLNNCFAYDLVPSPSVITAALRAARRVNDFPSAVRVFEGACSLCLAAAPTCVPSIALPLPLSPH